MSGITELSEKIKELEKQLDACSRCGMCQSVCPVYGYTGKEADVARGKLALLGGLAEEMFKDSRGVFKRLQRCLLCGSCEKACSCEVNILEIFYKTRVILAEYEGLSFSKRLILRKILSHPAVFERVLSFAAKYQKIFSKTAGKHQATSCARFALPVISNRHFQPLAVKPFHDIFKGTETKFKDKKIKAAFFPGCLTDRVFPHVAESVIIALEHHDIGVYMPHGQGCCGIPAISSGDEKTFKELVRHNVNLFEKEAFDYLITPCATCTFTIKKIWPMLHKDAPSNLLNSIRTLSEKTEDISRFLVSVGGINACASTRVNANKLTYHDPCHLKKSLGIYKEPRILAKSNPDFKFSEMSEADSCCGMGGSFNLGQYAISYGIGEEKLKNIISSGSTTVSTSCPACMMQLLDLVSKNNLPVSVKHVIEIYADSLKKKKYEEVCQ